MRVLHHPDEKRPYSRERALLDIFAVTDIVAFAIGEARTFHTADSGFMLYSVAVLTLLVGLWLVLRRHEYPIWAILALQFTVFGHLAGRFVVVGGLPLYRARIMDAPGDKIIHAFNSAAAAVFATALFRKLGLRLRGWEGFIVVMVVCGCGALVEIVEYGGTLVLPFNNVGGYANNMQDLVANLLGALAGWFVTRLAMGPAPDEVQGEDTH